MVKRKRKIVRRKKVKTEKCGLKKGKISYWSFQKRAKKKKSESFT